MKFESNAYIVNQRIVDEIWNVSVSNVAIVTLGGGYALYSPTHSLSSI